MRQKVTEWLGLSLSLFLLAGNAHGEYGINFPPPVSEGARQIYDIHMLTLAIATLLMVVITAIVAYSVWKHRKSRGFEADQHFHESWFGKWGWISVPVLVLGIDLAIAGSAQRTLERVWEVPEGKLMDVKVTGHQWWWEYTYLDHDITVESRATMPEQAGEHYLRDVDEPLVLPTDTRIRFLHTSADVLHAFWVPALGFKKDAIPGYVTETWAEIEQEGIYRGQCAELCGTWHSRMPVVVKAVSRDEFRDWLEQRKSEKAAAAAEADPNRTWTKVELMTRGKEAYESQCAACHQADGGGMPPTFPALKASRIALGPLKAHLDIVLNGKPGTAMQPWDRLSDLEIAAILTYERNAWGNGTGDVIQPAQVAAARADTQSAAR